MTLSSDGSAVVGIDAPRVARWLQEHVASLRAPCEFHLISGGQSNLTFEGEDAEGRRFVLRRPPLGGVLESAHDMAREHRIIGALAATGVPVPQTLGLCEDPRVNGAPFYVMDFADGHVVRDEADAERWLAPATRPRVGEAMIDALVALHAVSPDAVGLGDLARREDYVGRQLRRWSRQWSASADADVPVVSETHALLAAAIPAQRRTALVHGDFRMDNLVLSPAGEVVAVLDWELCTLGEPLADLGMLLVGWAAPGEPTSHLLSGTPSAAGGFCDRSALVARYAAGAGADVAEIDYFVAFSLWKLACIAEGIRARLASGAMGDVRGPGEAEMRAKIVGLAQAAHAILAG